MEVGVDTRPTLSILSEIDIQQPSRVITVCQNCARNARIFSDFTVPPQDLRNSQTDVSIPAHCAARLQSLPAVALHGPLRG